VQDRYAGDVGDFMKLALLERLRAPSRPGESSLSLAIVWYLVGDESHNSDGKHVGYLDRSSRSGRALRPIDPIVYDALGSMVSSGARSVEGIERSGALTVETVSFAERLRFDDLPAAARDDRRERRTAWLARAVTAVAEVDLVCLDPDNGIRRDDHHTPSHRNLAEKHAYLSEIAALGGSDRSIVVYHHADRSATVPVQAQRRLGDLASGIGREPLAAVRTSRGTARLFLVAPAERHRRRIGERLTELESSTAASEFEILWWQSHGTGSDTDPDVDLDPDRNTDPDAAAAGHPGRTR
jgi:hypothetical protein